MKFSESTASGGVEILVGLTDMHTLAPIKLTASNTTVKAGSPISAAGAVANTADAVGILLYDVNTAVNPNGTIIQSGPIDAAKGAASYGTDYAEVMIAALPAITFRTDIGTNS